MNPERWERVEKLFHAALELEADERSSFLEKATEDDEDLSREIESLLALDERAETFLETTALAATAQTIAGEGAPLQEQGKVLTLLFESEMGSARPEILVTSPKGHTRAVPLEASSVSLGRAPDNDLPFPDDDGLSRRHLIISPEEGRWILKDLGSKNGTLINGARIGDRHVLQPGDRISASSVTITFSGGKASRREP